MSGATFRGISLEQDKRYKDKEEKEIRKRSFPADFDLPVNVNVIKLDLIRPWIAKRVTAQLGGVEDEFLINYIGALLEEGSLDPKKMQIALIAFLGKKAAPFMAELWTMLLSAQSNGGVPPQLVEETKEDLRKRREEVGRVREGLAPPPPSQPAPPPKPETWIPPSFETMQKERDQRGRRGAPSGVPRDAPREKELERRHSPPQRRPSPPRDRERRPSPSRDRVRERRTSPPKCRTSPPRDRERERRPSPDGRKQEPLPRDRRDRSPPRRSPPRRPRSPARDERSPKRARLDGSDGGPEAEAELRARLVRSSERH